MFQMPATVHSPDSWPDHPSRLNLPPLEEERVYRGERLRDGNCSVWFEHAAVQQNGNEPTRRPLSLHLEVRGHSPTGFAWGYGGSGPAQLALALLVDALGDAELAEQHYQAFKWSFVARWTESWSITAREIREFVAVQTMGDRHDAPVAARDNQENQHGA